MINDNVLSITAPKVDVILACNFSYCIFKDRATLVRYLRGCLRSLRKDGVAMLDLAGGPGMIGHARAQNGQGARDRQIVYTWHQKSYDPISHDAKYAIHFTFPDGTKMQDAFTYDWRLWNIPEVREAMIEAGFSKTAVYWETEHKGEGTGEYMRSEHGDNAYAWVAYIVGINGEAELCPPARGSGRLSADFARLCGCGKLSKTQS